MMQEKRKKKRNDQMDGIYTLNNSRRLYLSINTNLEQRDTLQTEYISRKIY